MRTDRLVFSSVSNLPFKEVKRLADKFLAPLPARLGPRARRPVGGYQRKTQVEKRPITQAHCLVGGPAYPLSDARRIPFFMLNNILGGPGMNSRLNLAVREKYGLVYTIDSTYSPYTDTGLFGIYFGTEGKQLNRTVALVNKELKLLREKPLTTNQLHIVKDQLMGQLAMCEESNGGMMQLLGKSTLDLGRVEPLSEIFEQNPAGFGGGAARHGQRSAARGSPERTAIRARGKMSVPAFGHVGSYRPGDTFRNRIDLSLSRVHRPRRTGVCGTQQMGAESIVLAGQYEEDNFGEEELLYSGNGGRDPKTGHQITDQVATTGIPLALLKSIETSLPVRVLRKVPAEEGGPDVYRYEGLVPRGKLPLRAWQIRLSWFTYFRLRPLLQ